MIDLSGQISGDSVSRVPVDEASPPRAQDGRESNVREQEICQVSWDRERGWKRCWTQIMK